MNDKTFDKDISQRFLFTQMPVRGEVVQLDKSYQEVLSNHYYPKVVENLLGEFMVAACLMAATLKFEGKLILQARSDAQLGLIMAECTNQHVVRAVAQGYESVSGEDFKQMLAGGNLVITIEPAQGKRYQGVVPLEGDTLAACLQQYFEQSEQLHTRFWFAVFNGKAAGLLLQQLPAANNEREQAEIDWQHLCYLAETVKPVELLDLEAQELIYRLYHQDEHELFPIQQVNYQCSCSRERCLNALSTIPVSELEELLEHEQSVKMDCQFCGKQYEFFPTDFEAADDSDDAQILH